MVCRLVALLSYLLCGTAAYRDYQRQIPNGDAVPHPCKPNYLWDGVGHFLDDGSGFRNPFGEDFAAAGRKWTLELCRQDSDGDGLRNGQELGDPDCEWKENANPKQTTGLSHPGVCDPWDSPECFKKNLSHPLYKTQELWMKEMCQSDQFVCAGLSETGLRNISLRLSHTKVPARETTYECQIFDLTQMGVSDMDYHIIAIEPIIDNRYVLHHMDLFACHDDTEPTEPYHCDMTPSPSCLDLMSVWTLGLAGECLHPLAGTRIGGNGIKKVAVQLHWNNPQERADYTDSSGLLLHYTPNLRPNDAGIMTVGSMNFYLPPQREEVTVSGTCTSTCTKARMLGPVNLTRGWNHMHYLGAKMSVAVIRNNSHLTYLTDEKVYSYDSPKLYTFTEDPFLLMPGDQVETICTFNTHKKELTTFYGESTSDEMCFGLFNYFPKNNFVPFGYTCISSMGLNICETNPFGACKAEETFGQDTLVNSSIYKDVQKYCQPLFPCVQECLGKLKSYYQTEPCFEKQYWDYIQINMLIKTNAGKDFLARLASCQVEIASQSQTSIMAVNAADSAAGVTTMAWLITAASVATYFTID